MSTSTPPTIRQLAFVGTYQPRKCGIATFTTDLCQAVKGADTEIVVIAMNDQTEGYEYSDDVRFAIGDQDLASYRRAAQFLNASRCEGVSLQHEYGIFGGPAGSHIIGLLQELRLPVVTTFHTVLSEPDQDQRHVLQQIAKLSDRVVVMSQKAIEFLPSIYDIDPGKIDFIPHGIPDFPFVNANQLKSRFDVSGRAVLFTFGLLSPAKGLEHVIRALPEIKKQVPNVLYMILGQTHPHCIRESGETYRHGLQRLARELDVSDNLMFHNRFVDTRDLVDFIGAADVYITPYLCEEQITSGTLAWAVGAGKAVVSTPYWYAQELLADERGILVPFENSGAIADACCLLLTDEEQAQCIRERAYQYGRSMTWPSVAQQYLSSFRRAAVDRGTQPPSLAPNKKIQRRRGELPAVNLLHLSRMTDHTGLLQHARYTIPDYDHGYTTDDNARALTLTTTLGELGELPTQDVEELSMRYLAFLSFAFNKDARRFRNFLAYDHRRWLEDIGSEDSHGRAVWALGAASSRLKSSDLQVMAADLLCQALPAVEGLSSIRAWAHTLLGLANAMEGPYVPPGVHGVAMQLGKRLYDLYLAHTTENWRWFENHLTYANARLPQALLVIGNKLDQKEWVDAAITSLTWLCELQCADKDYFVPIGSNGFFHKDGERARFDQQPVEACATVCACLDAFDATHDQRWYHEAERAFEWFLGNNDLNRSLYDPRTGGCRDGLHPDRVNQNQGAESTISFLLSLTRMRLADQTLILDPAQDILSFS